MSFQIKSVLVFLSTSFPFDSLFSFFHIIISFAWIFFSFSLSCLINSKNQCVVQIARPLFLVLYWRNQMFAWIFNMFVPHKTLRPHYRSSCDKGAEWFRNCFQSVWQTKTIPWYLMIFWFWSVRKEPDWAIHPAVLSIATCNIKYRPNNWTIKLDLIAWLVWLVMKLAL